MRKESLVLQYRQLQKREIRLVNEKGGGPLEPSVRKMEAVITEKTNTDLMHEIAKAVEPALTGYLKHHTPFRQREERRRQLLKSLGVEAAEALYGLPTATIERHVKRVLTRSGLFAGFTGSVGAIGGIAVSMLELPLLLKTATDTLETVSEAYGNDAQNYFERLYLLLLIPFALTPNPEDRRLVYNKMKLVENWLMQSDIPLTEREDYYPPMEAGAFCAESIARALVFNRLMQAVPLAGALLGASMNYDFISRLGKSGLHFYKRRYLEKRLGL